MLRVPKYGLTYLWWKGHAHFAPSDPGRRPCPTAPGPSAASTKRCCWPSAPSATSGRPCRRSSTAPASAATSSTASSAARTSASRRPTRRPPTGWSRICSRRAARRASWRLGFRAALAELLRFVAEQPLLAKALLIEVRAARGQCLGQAPAGRRAAGRRDRHGPPRAGRPALDQRDDRRLHDRGDRGIDRPRDRRRPRGRGRAAAARTSPTSSSSTTSARRRPGWSCAPRAPRSQAASYRRLVPHRLFKKSCVNGRDVRICAADVGQTSARRGYARRRQR